MDILKTDPSLQGVENFLHQTFSKNVVPFWDIYLRTVSMAFMDSQVRHFTNPLICTIHCLD